MKKLILLLLFPVVSLAQTSVTVDPNGNVLNTKPTNFRTVGHKLTVDGVEITGAGGGLSDGDKGDITVSVAGTVWTIDPGVVTFAQLQDVSTNVILGRATAATGDIEQLSALPFALTGAITTVADSNVTSLGSFTTAALNTALSDNDIATGGGTATGTNTGDQTSIVGITGTKAQFDTAVTDGNFLYVGDIAGANPTASVGLAAVNGSATTFLRSDGAPALSQAITPTWSGLHIFDDGADIKNGNTSAGLLRIFEDSDDGTNKASFTVTALAADTAYTLPPNDGNSGEFLRTDGAGVLTWVAPAGGGNVSNSGTPVDNQVAVWTTATTVEGVTPTSPIFSDGTGIGLNVGVDFGWTVPQTISMPDNPDPATVEHMLSVFNNTSDTPANGLGAGIKFGAESSAATNRDQGSIETAWSDVTSGSRTAYMDFLLVNNAAALARKMRLFPSGAMLLNSGATFTDPGAGTIAVANGATGAGKLAILEDSDDGTNLASFTVPALAANTVYTLPPNDGDSGQLLRTDGAGVLTWVSAAGGGDVVGPASATDTALAVFDGTTGKLLKNSAITMGVNGILGFPDNFTQTFNPGADKAGINVGQTSGGDPSSPTNGDIWYDGSGDLLRARINGVSVSLGAGGGGTPGGADTQVQFNDGGAFGGDSGLVWNKTDNILTLTAASSTNSLIIANNPGASQRNNIKLNNTQGTTQSNQFIYQGNGTDRWVIGSDSNTAGTNDFWFYNATSGVSMLAFLNNTVASMNASVVFGWNSSTSGVNTTNDTALARNAAGVVEINNGTATTYRDLKARNVNVTTGVVLDENASVVLDPAGSADGKYTGTTITGTGGDTIAFGDLVTLDKDDSRWEKVDISVAAAATGDARGIIGIAVTSSTDGNPITVMLQGVIRADANFPALTIGAAVYASTTGDIVVAQPTTTDHVIRIVGFALTADEIWFAPANMWITKT